MMNEMKDIYPDGPITNGDKKLMEMMNKNERMMHDCRDEQMQLVRDRLEDMYWTLAPKLNEFQKDKLDDATLEYRLKVRKILLED